MKLSSVIFLIVSAVIIIAGISCTVIADNIAKDDGIKIYNVIKDDSGDYVCEYVFENFLPEKISLSAEKLTVNVYGNSDENKIVYKNFPKGTFTLSYSNRVFELKTNEEFLDYVNPESVIKNFKGIRDYLTFPFCLNKEKTVDVYLNSASALRFLEINAEELMSDISDISTQTEYSIYCSDGNVNFKNVNSNNKVKIDIKNGNFTAKDSKLFESIINIESGNVDMSNCELISSDITVSSDSGTININGEKYTNLYSASKDSIIE